MEIVLLTGVLNELDSLKGPERSAMANALEKLKDVGMDLSYPHSSQVMGTRFRELRPRRGRSPWRVLYVRVEDRFVLCALAPEAQSNPRGFRRALTLAEDRLSLYQQEIEK
jgi:phage-related protein